MEQLLQIAYGDGEIGVTVALNVFTNYFNEVAGTGLGFSAAPDPAAP